MVEIERKFLVKNEDFKAEFYQKNRITQGFLNTDPLRTVRIRIKDETAFLTVKGKNNEAGLSRFEWEKEIDKTEAEALLKLCEPGMIDKTRFLVKSASHIFEVDEFYGENEGLIVAEVELASENENFEKPKWLGQEVTGDPKYYNSQLSKNPYKSW
ncbi:CYTH domain-containing protein [Zunongwangia sp. SCSIO 43204]|uniref:CYTH domain-containing protein n=1 Tax=Zunongwangia sp. SCSIO 43204 TaxID=2779359 RepID=UPI001CA9C630|nr:CYTH domain-containing protein [Zunongwangia sp. SCSIO 43204]UAB85156.1 CYTH domain-containing protein [Zunongwangia sp. SCSIO 43204]